jgi:hypothetical protein
MWLLTIIGDFNSSEVNFEYHVLVKLLGSSFADTWEEYTLQTLQKKVDISYWITHANDAKRLDYIFYKHSSSWKLLSSALVMKHEDGKTLISDHFGVEAHFKLLPVNSTNYEGEVQDSKTTLNSEFIEKMHSIVEEGLSKVKRRKSSHRNRAGFVFLCLIVAHSLFREWIPIPITAAISAYHFA